MMSDFRTTRLAGAFLLAAGLSIPALAQSGMQEGAPAEAQPEQAQADLPEGFEVLERHVEAIGGTEAGMELEGLRMTGTMSIPAMGMQGDISVSAAPPAKQLVEIEIQNMGSIVQGTDGEKAWASQPGGEPEMVPEPQAEAMAENADFYLRFKPRERYQSATTTGTETMDGTEVHVVELVSNSGEQSLGYFRVDNGLQLAEKTRTAPGATTFSNEVRYLDYQEVEGMKFPMKLVMTQGGFTQEMTFESVEVNPEFDAGTFDAPGDL